MSTSEQLWKRLEEVLTQRQDLERERNRLFEERSKCDHKPTPQWKIQQIESAYWATEGSVRSLQGLEATLVEAIERFERGEEVPNLKNLLPQEDSRAERTLSKRRRAIAADERFSPRDADFVIDPFFVLFKPNLDRLPETRMLTTGRHAKRLKGDFTDEPGTIAAMFFAATTDTHGGKVRKGVKYQNGTAYLAKSGKVIRKR